VGGAVGTATIQNLVKALMPVFGVLLFVLMGVTYVPAVPLWLPNLVLSK
jgi:TRAP-type C4-dicarboxylate transport system permease large subunit